MTMRSPLLQRGLSLVELMIAMALSMLLLLGALQMFLSSKQTYSANSSLARVQESGRFALDFISYDLRNAGYRGECVTPVNALTANPTDPRFDPNEPLRGWEAQTSLPAWPTNFSTDKKAGTDSLLIKHAALSAGALNTVNDIEASASSLPMTGGKAGEGDYVLISNALGCDIFQSGASSATAIAKASAGNFSQDYPSAITKVLLYQSNQYFLKNGAESSEPSLWRVRWNNQGTAQVEELVEGIHDLQFEYGIGTGVGANRSVSNDAFVKANAVTNWNEVVAVKVRLLALGNQPNVSPDLQSYDHEKGLICKRDDAACDDANTIDIPDRRLAQVFTTTVSLRNQLP